MVAEIAGQGAIDLSRTVAGQPVKGARRDLSPSPPLYSGDRSRTGTGQPAVRYIKADVKVPSGERTFTVQHVSWLPSEGWACDCGKAGCVHVETVKEAVR